MLRNLVGVVTGGASGLGKAAARLLAEEGCKITICDKPESAGKEVEKLLQKLQPDAAFVAGDVRSETDMDNLFSNVLKRHSRLDFLVNCAGISYAQKMFNLLTGSTINLKTLNYVMETNVLGTVNATALGSKAIAANQPDEDGLRGTIINILGTEAFDGQLGQVPCSISSGALASSVLPMSRDLSGYGIRVNGICVGLIETPVTSNFPTVFNNFIADSCLGPKRLGKPEEFAHAVKFILENKYVNASILTLNAGIRLHLH